MKFSIIWIASHILRAALATLLLPAISVAVAEEQDLLVNERPALPFPPGVSVQSQCGTVNDLQDVELYDGTTQFSQQFVIQNEPSTVQLQWMNETSITSRLPDYSPGNVGGERWCTGTLISDRLVLTAGHCFDVQRGELGWVTPFKIGAGGGPAYAEPKLIAKLLVVNFGYQVDKDTGAVRLPDVFPIVELPEYRENDLDYAIVEVGPNAAGKLPGDRITPAQLQMAPPASTDALAIIQHPQGQPKKFGAGHVLKVSPKLVFYNDIDTWGGSSGSGIRGRDGKILGVHTNGGCTSSPGGGANRGVSIEAISEASQKF